MNGLTFLISIIIALGLGYFWGFTSKRHKKLDEQLRKESEQYVDEEIEKDSFQETDQGRY